MLERNKEIMEHALGINDRKHGSYRRHGKKYVKSYRKYYCASEGHHSWNNLLELQFNGLLGARRSTYDDEHVYFFVTDKGIKELEKERNYVIRFVE